MLKKLLSSSLLAFLTASAFAQGTVLVEENFNAGNTLPANWSQTTLSSDGGWLVDVPDNLSSGNFPFPGSDGNIIATNDDGCDCDKSADVLYLPSMNLSLAPSIYLFFDLFYINGAYQGDQETLELKASTDGGTTWTTVKSFDGQQDWRLEVVDLTAYAGNADVRLNFTYNDGGGWLYGAGIDNVQLVLPDNVLRTSVGYAYAGRYIDAIPAVLDGYDKFWVGGHMSIEGTIVNDGFVPITSFTASWTKGTQTVSQTYDGLNIPITKSYTFTLDLPALVAGSNNGDYIVSITNINGGDDNDASDNEVLVNVNVEGVEPVEGRKVVLEEATGTWCQWCPRGAVMMDFLHEEYPVFAIPIAVHNADPMVVADYDTGMGALISGYPSGLVDRADGEWDPLQFEQRLIDRMTIPAPVSVQHNASYNAATRTVTIESFVHFNQEMNGNYQIATVVTEDDVTGATSTYRQSNVYSGGAFGPMGGFESLPTLVPANQMVYNHVARNIFDGFEGTSGTVPASNAAGSTVTATSTYTHPASQDGTQLHAVTMLIDLSSGEIINAEETAVPFTITATNNPVAVVNLDVYPNPTSDLATVSLNLEKAKDVQLRLTDISGKVVYEANLGNLNGEQKIPVRVRHLQAGTYMMSINAGGEVTTKPLTVVR